MENEDFEYGYQQGQKDVEQHMVHPEVINSINDQHIDEIHFLQDRITALQRENERLRDKEKTTTNLLHKWHGDVSRLKVDETSLIRKRQIMLEMEALLTKEKN